MTTIVTHSGSFHPDDVFAVATLLIKYPEAEVVRSRNKEIIENATIAVDVGLVYDPKSLRFDHHQSGGAGVRENGIPYASFGLVWKEIGEELAGIEASKLIEEKLVMPIDAPDNGISTYTQVFENVRPYSIADFLYSFVVNGEKDESYIDNIFMSVVGIGKELLKREILKAQERVSGMKEVEKIVKESEDKRIIVLPKDLPWEAVLVREKETAFVIYPRREGNWGVKGVPVTIKDFKRKKYLPSEWGGKSGIDLQKITGVEDAVFCHKDLFIAAAQSKEGAIALAKLALEP